LGEVRRQSERGEKEIAAGGLNMWRLDGFDLSTHAGPKRNANDPAKRKKAREYGGRGR